MGIFLFRSCLLSLPDFLFTELHYLRLYPTLVRIGRESLFFPGMASR